MNSLLLSTEKRNIEEENEPVDARNTKASHAYLTQPHEFLKNHSEVRTEMRVPLLIKGSDGSEVNLKTSSAMNMALERHKLEQEQKLYVKELHLLDHNAKIEAGIEAKNQEIQ
jgi:hypothetical protein